MTLALEPQHKCHILYYRASREQLRAVPSVPLSIPCRHDTWQLPYQRTVRFDCLRIGAERGTHLTLHTRCIFSCAEVEDIGRYDLWYRSNCLYRLGLRATLSW